ncbi:MAG TPA: TerB family tellurite resistance protein [Chitinophagaceae bacterium]|nr:TerB family tellurite resistance protein [Chitinophagaceae bacterium]
MKKILLFVLLSSNICIGQSQEAKQLLLNVEKLAQLKLMLSHMKTGYKILEKGYTSIKNISQGNFNLHRDFLDGLLQVSPAVKKYSKVADIIRVQLKLVKEAKDALAEFRRSRQFTVAEIEYLGNVYANLLKESLKMLDELAMVVTAGKLRMSDDERLQAIDKIYDEVMEQYTFLNEFNNGTAILSLQREKEKMDIDLMRKVHGLK